MPFRPSLTHILLFVIILVLLFGARRLPEVGGAMGKALREFKRGIRQGEDPAVPPPASDAGPKTAPPNDVKRTN